MASVLMIQPNVKKFCIQVVRRIEKYTFDRVNASETLVVTPRLNLLEIALGCVQGLTMGPKGQHEN